MRFGVQNTIEQVIFRRKHALYPHKSNSSLQIPFPGQKIPEKKADFFSIQVTEKQNLYINVILQ